MIDRAVALSALFAERAPTTLVDSLDSDGNDGSTVRERRDSERGSRGRQTHIQRTQSRKQSVRGSNRSLGRRASLTGRKQSQSSMSPGTGAMRPSIAAVGAVAGSVRDNVGMMNVFRAAGSNRVGEPQTAFEGISDSPREVFSEGGLRPDSRWGELTYQTAANGESLVLPDVVFTTDGSTDDSGWGELNYQVLDSDHLEISAAPHLTVTAQLGF